MEDIKALAQAQRDFFGSGMTLEPAWRKKQLQKLLDAVEKYEKPLYDALWADLHKSEQEAYLCEISIVKGEIRTALDHLDKWVRPTKVRTPITHFPASSKVVTEPLGCSLIIAPWNYPVTLLLCPLVGAIASGCTAMLKPSPYVPSVSGVLSEMIEWAFGKEYIALVQGHREVNEALLEQRWDLIFFTGSPAFGKTVMAAAAKHLTPVVLELGGKSPCIVAADADIKLAARRVAWGKILNCGQTCIAPDYLLVQSSVANVFVEEFKKAVKDLLGKNPKKSKYYVRMVSDKAYRRVKSYLDEGVIVAGGGIDDAERYIEPTIITGVDEDAAVMTEEIFGPVLPMITYSNLRDVQEFVSAREKPLAFYYFGREKDGEQLIAHTSSGGACINDTIMHFANGNLPFGGVGNSGMGHYHGRGTFEAFSHRRGVLSSSTSLDMPFRYMPYRFVGLLKKLHILP